MRIRTLTFALALMAQGVNAAPLFKSSIVSTDFDIIKTTDPGTLACILRKGQGQREMPSKLRGGLFVNDVSVFEARYKDGATVELWVHPNVSDRDGLVRTVADTFGRLPTLFRDKTQHIVLNDGDATASAEKDAGFFVLYEKNVAKRVSTRDLEETMFHESVHVTLDDVMAADPDWISNQRADGQFLTAYGKSLPGREDLAETFLFSYALRAHPDRLPAKVAAAIRNHVPNRLEYLANMVPLDSLTYSAGPAPGCGG